MPDVVTAPKGGGRSGPSPNMQVNFTMPSRHGLDRRGRIPRWEKARTYLKEYLIRATGDYGKPDPRTISKADIQPKMSKPWCCGAGDDWVENRPYPSGHAAPITGELNTNVGAKI